jgi:hypothetical protein
LTASASCDSNNVDYREISYKFEVKCPSDVGIVPSDNTLKEKKKNYLSGDLVFELDPFSTIISGCPINKYFVSSGLSTQITQPMGCISAYDTSQSCRTVTIKDNVLGVYVLSFTVEAEGGNTSTATFTFEIECGFPIGLASAPNDPAIS